MRLVNVLLLLGFVVMAGVIVYGVTQGNFRGEGSVLISMPWGIVTLVDLYLGFVLFSGWNKFWLGKRGLYT